MDHCVIHFRPVENAGPRHPVILLKKKLGEAWPNQHSTWVTLLWRGDCICWEGLLLSLLMAKDMQPTFPRTFNIPLELTPNSQPTAYEGIPFIWGVADALQDFDQDSPSWTFSERCLMWPRQSTKDIKASYSVLQNAWFLKQTQLYQDSFWSDEVIGIPPVNHGPLGKFDHSTRHLTSVSAFSSLKRGSPPEVLSPTWERTKATGSLAATHLPSGGCLILSLMRWRILPPCCPLTLQGGMS